MPTVRNTLSFISKSIIDPAYQEIENIFQNPTKVKVQRAVHYAMPIVIPAAVMSRTDRTYSCGVTGFLFGCALAVFGAVYLHDYDDAKELEQLRTEAKGMNWQQLLKAHELKTIVSKELVSTEELQEKFENAHANLTLTEITKKYSLSMIRNLSNRNFLQKAVLQDLQENRVAFLLKTDLEDLKTSLEEPLYLALTDIKTKWITHADAHVAHLAALDLIFADRTEKRDLTLAAKKEQNDIELKKFEEEQPKPDFLQAQLERIGISGEAMPKKAVAEEKARLKKEWLAEKYDTLAMSSAATAQVKYNMAVVQALNLKEQREIGMLADLNSLLANF